MVADISWHSSRGSDPIPLVVAVMVRHAFCIMPVRSCLNGHVLQAAICLCEIDSLQAMREEGLISPGCSPGILIQHLLSLPHLHNTKQITHALTDIAQLS